MKRIGAWVERHHDKWVGDEDYFLQGMEQILKLSSETRQSIA